MAGAEGDAPDPRDQEVAHGGLPPMFWMDASSYREWIGAQWFIATGRLEAAGGEVYPLHFECRVRDVAMMARVHVRIAAILLGREPYGE